ncbi:hypothetical protein N0V90_007529 [Kalmusia sp. IMI 367209]|nr:hypothetical protein N0V90_007529 [Kalmusia sp. IMI 367209]
MLDPDFPYRLLQAGQQRTVKAIQSLSAEYSTRGLTYNTDRFAAISGLENRIARAKRCEARFGIFQTCLHRSLLWQKSGESSMDRIEYKTQIVPSWSWMAYDGQIQFMDVPFHEVYWVRSLRFNKRYKYRWLKKTWKCALVTVISFFQNCSLEQRGASYAILDSGNTERGWIQYDIEVNARLDAKECVVLGRQQISESDVRKWEYYILVVRLTDVDNEYERVGVGCIQSDYVRRHGSEALIV